MRLLGLVLILVGWWGGCWGGLVLNEAFAYSSRLLKPGPSGGSPGVGTPWYYNNYTRDAEAWWVSSVARISEVVKGNSLYLRCYFNATSQQISGSLSLSIDWSDGFIAYLNGNEIMRKNLGTTTQYAWFDTASFNPRTTAASVTFSPDPPASSLTKDNVLPGLNVFSLQVHNDYAFPVILDSSVKAIFTLSSSNGVSFITPTTATCKKFVGVEEPSTVFDPVVPPTTGIVQQSDWVEFWNNDSKSLDLSGWSLTDDDFLKQKWIFPVGTVISPYSYLLILCDSLNYKGNYLHTNFELSNNGGSLYIYDSELKLQYSFRLPKASPFHSYGLVNNMYQHLTVSTPGKANIENQQTFLGVLNPPTLSIPGGFYNSTIIVSLSTDLVGSEIWYTLSANDITSSNALVYTGPLTISSSTIIRAKSVMNGYISSETITQTYLIYPSNSIMRSIPSIILTGNPGTTFYKPDGIFSISGGFISNGIWTCSETDYTAYNIPDNRGQWTERPVAVAFHFPPSYGFSNVPDMNAGIRVSASDWTRGRLRLTYDRTMDDTTLWPNNYQYKPSMNLYFRSDYGKSRLDGKIIPNSKYQSNKRFRIRAGKNDPVNPFIIDEWARRVYSDMGQPSVTGFISFLFVNGVLKDVYNPVQKVDEYWLGQVHNVNSDATWDIFKLVDDWESGDNKYLLEMKTWGQQNSLSSVTNYLYFITKYINVDSVIDYLLANSYFGTWDWPRNNAYIARQRTTGPNGRFRFYMWDAEGAFSGSRTPSYDTFASDLMVSVNFNADATSIPAIFQILNNSPEFKLRWADRVQKHLFRNGALTNSNLGLRWRQLSNEYAPVLQQVLSTSFSNSTFDTWVNQRRSNYFTQLVNYGLWQNSVLAPNFTPYGGQSLYYLLVSIKNPNAGGKIYYTLNGTDPRAIGGSISGSLYSSSFNFTVPTRLCSRILNGLVWSPIECASYSIVGEYDLAITEIMYNPEGGSAYEFIEIKNTGVVELDLTGIEIQINGITAFKFPDATVLDSGEFYVSAYEPDTFLNYYGWSTEGRTLLTLPNGGGTVSLYHGPSRITILSVTYGDSYPWPPITDGLGFSLVTVNSNPDPKGSTYNLPISWRQSTEQGGSPGSDDPSPIQWPLIKVNEFSPNPSSGSDWIELYNPESVPVDISYWYLTDNFYIPRKYQFQNGTIIASKGYLVLDTDTLGFSLSAKGEEVWLFNGITNERLLGYYQGYSYQSAPSSDIIFARYTDCNGRDFYAIEMYGTPSATNSPPKATKMGDLVFSVIDNTLGAQFVEFRSISPQKLHLDGWILEKKDKMLFNFTGVILPPWSSIRVISNTPTNSNKSSMEVGPLLSSIDPLGTYLVLKQTTTTQTTILSEANYNRNPSWPQATPIYLSDYLKNTNDPCSWSLHPPPELAFTTQVYYDRNHNGVWEPADTIIGGVKVTVQREGEQEPSLVLSTTQNGLRLSRADYPIVSTLSRYSFTFDITDTAISTIVPFPYCNSTKYTWNAGEGSIDLRNYFAIDNKPFVLKGIIKYGTSFLSGVSVKLYEGSVIVKSTVLNGGSFTFSEADGLASNIMKIISIDLSEIRFNDSVIWSIDSASSGWKLTGTIAEVTLPIGSYGRGIETSLNLNLLYEIVPVNNSPQPQASNTTQSLQDDAGPLGLGLAISWGIISAIIVVGILVVAGAVYGLIRMSNSSEIV